MVATSAIVESSAILVICSDRPQGPRAAGQPKLGARQWKFDSMGS